MTPLLSDAVLPADDRPRDAEAPDRSRPPTLDVTASCSGTPGGAGRGEPAVVGPSVGAELGLRLSADTDGPPRPLNRPTDLDARATPLSAAPATAGETKKPPAPRVIVTRVPGEDAIILSPAPLISCCVIARDEAGNLPELFASADDVVDEWIVVDTGSTDDTRAIAAAHGARVFEFPWIEDFSAARNFCLDQATGEWILVLDADDRLQSADSLRSFLSSDPEADVLAVPVISPLQAGHEYAVLPRLFRRSASVRYEYPVHEQPMLDGLRLASGPAAVLHTGYQDSGRVLQQAGRYLGMLEKMPRDSLHRRYNSLRMAAVLGRWDDVLRDGNWLRAHHPPVPVDAATLWVRALLALGRPVEAVRLAADLLEDHPSHPDLFHALLHAAATGFAGAAIRVLREPGPHWGPLSSIAAAPELCRGLVSIDLLQPRAIDLLDAALTR